MNKEAPTLGRILTMVGFALSCFGLLLFLWLAFGGSIPLAPRGYQFHVEFPEATQLAKEADVRISGVPVGKVKDLQPDVKTGLTNATIELDAKYAPVPRDARAILRQKTLLGETYVELTPGSRGNKKMALKEDGTLPRGNVAPTVQLDEIFRAFNPKTRLAFQQWMIRSSEAFAGRSEDINNALGNLGPTVDDANSLVQVLNSQQGAVRNLVKNTGVVFAALSARHGQLSSLIRNSNVVFGVTARQNAALKATFEVLPTFEQESRAHAGPPRPLRPRRQPAGHPAAARRAPALADAQRSRPPEPGTPGALPRPRAADRRVGQGTAGDLDLPRPGAAGARRSSTRSCATSTRRSTSSALYKEELNAFFSQTVAATQAVTFPPNAHGQPVHYLRTTNPVNPENLAIYGRRLATNRPNPYQAPGAFRFLSQIGHLKVFENRQCTSGPTPVAPVGTDPLLPILDTFFFQSGIENKVAPPCDLQRSLGPQLGFGNKNYPHVAAQPPSK